MYTVECSTPSRLCLFGEHQDYLGLEVIALAIDLRFSAKANFRDDDKIVIKIRNKCVDTLNEDTNGNYEEHVISLNEPITYNNNRDYLKSSINVIRKNGYEITRGMDILMDSRIPIGKGMCSSSAMILVFIKAVMEMIDADAKNDKNKLAHMAFTAEVTEFNEPGGMMDHYTSAMGGLIHLDFFDGAIGVHKLDFDLPGVFILIDSHDQKDTLRVLMESKTPSLEALKQLKPFGITSVRDFIGDPDLFKYTGHLDPFRKRKFLANISNYEITLRAKQLLTKENFDMAEFGKLLKLHHKNLRDGLSVSTEKIESLLDLAYKNGALGGKINGSGGGGCCYVYSEAQYASKIIAAVEAFGCDAKVIKQDVGIQ